MHYSKLDEIRNYMLVHRRLVVSIMSILIVGVFVWVFQTGYSSRYENEFDEIQGYLEEIREKDKDIYNKLNLKEVRKEVKGIDVSSWQKEIDWNKVALSGEVDFVYIRCGFRNLSNANINIDKKFKYNISEANRLGIPVGVYFYSTAMNEKEVLEEATFVLNLIKDYDVTYPIVYDFESFGSHRTKNVSYKRINDNGVKFLDYMRSHGYQGMLYANLHSLTNNQWDLSKYEGYKLWYAQYYKEVTYDGKYDMWQYTSDGKVDGIDTRVDMNIGYFAYEDGENNDKE